MFKTRAVLIACACAICVMAIAIPKLLTARRVSETQLFDEKSEGLNEILRALAIPPPTTASTSNNEPIKESLKKRREAIEKLRTNASVFLPRLMQEVYAVGTIETTNGNAAAARTAQLALAFEALDGEARPLLPQLKDEFYAGRSIGPTVAAFQYIGGTDCGLILVSGLTNTNPLVRNAVMSVLSSFATNRDIAVPAVHPLRQLLKDNSAFSRALAASVLGSFRQVPDAVITDLIQVAKTDSDFVARVSAVKAIGRFGTNAAAVKPELESIEANDREASVRRMAAIAIRAVAGETSRDEVQ
jgi:hypothetical protein